VLLHEAICGPSNDRVFEVPHVGTFIMCEDTQDEHPRRVHMSDVQGL